MFLSKTDFIDAEDCVKALWLKKNRKDLIAPVDEATQRRFDVGNAVQEVARLRYPTGVICPQDKDIIKDATETKALSEKNDVLLEATAVNENGTFCRIDIMEKRGDVWDLTEIKSAAEVKDYYIDDLAFQKYVFQTAGYSIDRCKVLYINNKYVRQKELDIEQLFTLEDVTEQVNERLFNVPAEAENYLKIQVQEQEPQIFLKSSCQECPFYHYCGKDVPEYSIFDLLRSKEADAFYAQNNSLRVEDVPESYCSTLTQLIDRDAYLTGQIHVEPAEIKAFLDTLEYPLYYLDFETAQLAIPLFENSKPYAQIPFQYSLHIQREKDGPVEHKGYLHKEKSDPRRKLAEQLIADCGKTGSIIAYNATFEKTRIKELANLFPDLSDDLLALNERMADQLIPFRQRALYSPKQKTSASIKYVLPAFSDLSYKDMEVHNGGEAMSRYQAFLENRLTAEEEKILFDGLDAYCGQDTYAMVVLMKVLYQYAG